MNKDVILIVDDEPDISLILKLQLEDAGYQTVRARDGLEALEYLEKDSFTLILLDIKMPRMDGMQVLAKVRADYPAIAVIMMTAHGSGILRKGHEEGRHRLYIQAVLDR